MFRRSNRWGLCVWLVMGVSMSHLAVAGPAGAEIITNPVDDRVLSVLTTKGITPSGRCSDEIFVRRVFLDTIGTLPTPPEVRTFFADKSPDKRAKLIDALLQRPEFAEYWGLKWGDLLRIKAEFPSNLWPNAVQGYDRWIRDCFRQNKPYDQFVRELLTASGSNFRSPSANFYRPFQERSARQIADTVALVFMGIRLGNAGLTQSQIDEFSAFFAKVGYKSTDEWKEEIVFFNSLGCLTNSATGKEVVPRTLDGRVYYLPSDRDPRVAFADWLTAPGNPWFAKCMVNRVWFWLIGRGLVHEPDDFRPSNPASSPELLADLERELISHKYDLKSVYRLILNSATYQRSSTPNAGNAADETGFSHYRLRRLDAEPLLDAINQITGTGEKYTSSIPEPFTFLPDDQRAICLADGSIELPFLELFGRPARNTSFESERSAAPSMFQAQHLLNSSHIQKKIERSPVLMQLAKGDKPKGGGRMRAAGEGGAGKGKGKGKGTLQEGVVGGLKKPFEVLTPVSDSSIVDELYLLVLSRFPSGPEKLKAGEYLASPKRKPAESVCDLAWALINSTEFVMRH